jgi:hypothetical protein
MIPDIGKGFPGNVSAVHIKESARLNNSPVGDETKSRASQTSSGYGIHSVGVEGYRFFVLFCSLPKNAVIMGRASGFKLQRGLFPLIIKPV